MKGKNTEYYEKIDHLRCFAAFLIIIHHSARMYYLVCATDIICKLHGGALGSEPPFCSLIQEGHTAVALFMTLSGFLFATICKDKDINPWRFYRNRFLRIYPLFIAVLLVCCYLGKNDFLSLMTSLCFLQNTKSAVYLLGCTESLWAIAVEFQFYLLFPLLLLFFRKYGCKYLVGLVVLALLTRIVVYVATQNGQQLAFWTIFGRLDQFVIGMIYGFSFQAFRNRLRHPFILAIPIACIAVLVSHFHRCGFNEPGPHWTYIVDLEGIIWGLFIVCYNASAFKFPQAIGRILALGGTLSYSLYLIHPAVMRLAFHVAPFICVPHSRFPALAHLSLLLSHHSYVAGLLFAVGISFPVTVFISIFTYNLIEKPFLELRSIYTLPRKNKIEELEEPARSLGVTSQLVAAKH